MDDLKRYEEANRHMIEGDSPLIRSYKERYGEQREYAEKTMKMLIALLESTLRDNFPVSEEDLNMMKKLTLSLKRGPIRPSDEKVKKMLKEKHEESLNRNKDDEGR